MEHFLRDVVLARPESHGRVATAACRCALAQGARVRFRWSKVSLFWEGNPSPKRLPSGKLTVCYGTSPFIIGKSTVNQL